MRRVITDYYNYCDSCTSRLKYRTSVPPSTILYRNHTPDVRLNEMEVKFTSGDWCHPVSWPQFLTHFMELMLAFQVLWLLLSESSQDLNRHILSWSQSKIMCCHVRSSYMTIFVTRLTCPLVQERTLGYVSLWVKFL